jgi:hypothetical protein
MNFFIMLQKIAEAFSYNFIDLFSPHCGIPTSFYDRVSVLRKKPHLIFSPQFSTVTKSLEQVLTAFQIGGVTPSN